jgi:23S rRNA (adenine2503-C2)-methyltransferase
MIKEPLFGKTLPELEEVAAGLGVPRYTGRQIAAWLYGSDTATIDGMTNLSKASRGLLQQNFNMGLIAPEEVRTSEDGTKKYLFAVQGGRYVEAAYIPEKDRATLCLSTQVGCRMGCRFCMTGRQGFHGQLTAGEILNQLRSLPERHDVTNIVYMGMGEPLDNLDNVLKSLTILTAPWGFAMSHRRITVSTIGLITGIKEFLEKSSCHLAVSLHTPFPEERLQLMPVEHAHPLRQIIDTIRSFDVGRQRRVSFEYILFRDVNDTPRHVKELARLLNGIRCRVNLIRFHSIPGIDLQSPDEAKVIWFRNALNGKSITATVRASRGQDIQAACGLLSTAALSRKFNDQA